MSVADNKKARFDYEILETFEAGLALFGFEVKGVKSGKMSIKGSYVKIYGGEVWLVGSQISPYQEKNTPENYDPKRARKLLLNKKEINKLFGATKENLTIMPLKVYNKKGKLKIEIAIAKSRKKYDKRELIKKRDMERETKKVGNR